MKRRPFFMVLLPVFFVLHGFLENLEFISIKEVALLLGIYLSATFFLFLCFYLLYKKNTIKASLITAFLMAFYLFFGVIQDFFEEYINLLSKFSVILPLFVITSIVLFIYIKRTNYILTRLILFLNILFIFYVTLDVALIIIKKITSGNNVVPSTITFTDKINIPLTANRPDIYFLLFDEYASSASLKKYYGFNNDLDSFLQTRGFHIQEQSRSNYNFTVLSMASMLNLSYINNFETNMILTPKRMNQGYLLIKDNEVVKFLSNQGYDIINYSIFDFKENLTPIKQAILPLNTRMITAGTLLPKLLTCVYWPVVLKRFHLENTIKTREYYQNELNEKIFKLTKWQSTQHTKKPVFIYSHFITPHAPFYYNKHGKLRDAETLFREKGLNRPAPYLENLLHTNAEIKQLIDSIQYNTKGNAVIILMGDHGLRVKQNDPRNFCNMNAVYFPSKNYTLLQDSITCVNQFRAIFNSLFDLSIPFLKDSCIYLKENQ